MSFLAKKLIMPFHGILARINSIFPFSVAGILICGTFAALVAYLLCQLYLLVVKKERISRVCRIMVTVLCTGLGIYSGFCMLWGVYYYGTDFAAESGLSDEPVSVEQLYDVTAYFADMLSEYSSKVDRDENGIYCGDREVMLEKSDELFSNAEKLLPTLKGPAVEAKPFMFSRIMSLLDFTGFFFPFTAEANVNTDFPPSLFAATIAHELSHQRGVAREQEANFTAVFACMNFDDADFVYSGAMLAYVYLGNSLYSANYGLWEQIYSQLDDNVKKDLAYNNAYWRQFDTAAKDVSNTVYEGFLQSYDQQMGLKSYGACVDLLVNYYYERIK